MPTHRAFTRRFVSGLTKGLSKVLINAVTRDLTGCYRHRHTKPRPASHRTHIGSFQRTLFSSLFVCVGLLGWTIAEGSNNTLEEVTVTATLLNEASPALSATVLAEPQMQQRGAVHLENMISLAPNVASSSGASRNRFSKSPPTIEIIDDCVSNNEALKPIYVPAPPRIFPDDSVGVSISS